MRFFVHSASAPGEDEGPHEIAEAVRKAASARMAALGLQEAELVAQNPKVEPYLAAIIGDFMDHAAVFLNGVAPDTTRERNSMTTLPETHTTLSMSAVTKLTDAAVTLVNTMYDLERARKRAIQARASALASELDLFGAGEHYTDHEDYVPAGDDR